MPGGGREKEERQYEKEGGDIGENGVPHPQDSDALKCEQNDQAIAENIVVQRPEELGTEERREAALAEK